MVGAIPIEILIRKEELIIYDEKAKLRTMKYLDSKREQLKLNLPLGTKEIWRGIAEEQGMSVTALITKLMDDQNNDRKA